MWVIETGAIDMQPKCLKFASKGDYIVLYGDKKAVIIKIDEKRGPEIHPKSYIIPENENRFIMDVQISCERSNEGDFKCMVAEFEQDIYKIVIRNFHTGESIDRTIGLNFQNNG